jgi:phospholipase C
LDVDHDERVRIDELELRDRALDPDLPRGIVNATDRVVCLKMNRPGGHDRATESRQPLHHSEQCKAEPASGEKISETPRTAVIVSVFVMRIERRGFLRSLIGTSGASFLAQLAGERSLDALAWDTGLLALPPPEASGIEHIIVMMMENRSFDHVLGWLPNARGIQAGLTYLDAGGVPHRTYRLRTDDKGCGHPDPDHSYQGGREQYNGGTMDGFLRSGSNDEFAIGYYVERDRPVLGALARNFTALDRCFCSILGPTFPNKIFLHAAQTDRLENTFDFSSLPTIWDRLADAGVSATYYYSNIPFLGLWGLKYLPISDHIDRFYEAAAAGTLPAVSFIDPRFTVSEGAVANDDHPHADIRAGDALLSDVFHAVAGGPGWNHTALFLTYDEWGGFFDHVPPPRADAPNLVDPDIVDGKALLGFRVPGIVISPWTRGNPDSPRVKRFTFDHTSALKLIEWRWGLEPLTARDASADIRNLAWAFDFARPDYSIPSVPSPNPPLPRPCPLGDEGRITREGASDNTWLGFLQSGQLAGWPIYL